MKGGEGKNSEWIAIIISVIALMVTTFTSCGAYKVSMFEKRYEVFKEYSKIIQYANGAKQVLESKELEKYIDEGEQTEMGVYLYFSCMNVLTSNTNDSELPILELGEEMDNTKLVESHKIIIQRINELNVELEAAKYIFHLTQDEKNCIDGIISNLQECSKEEFILSGADNIKANLIKLTEQIITIQFMEHMENKISLPL